MCVCVCVCHRNRTSNSCGGFLHSSCTSANEIGVDGKASLSKVSKSSAVRVLLLLLAPAGAEAEKKREEDGGTEVTPARLLLREGGE